jgi:hypothetical protein
MIFVAGRSVAKLVEVATGHEVPARGLDSNYYMWMPQFSPDGTKVVFNHAKPDANRPGFTDRRELAVMDYDRATQTFSNLKVIVSKLGPEPSLDYDGSPALAGSTTHGADACIQRNPNDPSGLGALPASICAEPCYPAWPFFTPDGKGVIFTLTDYPDFLSSCIGSNVLSDPSSPAFYLEGQGSRGNMRAFAALNLCRADGSACAIGVDCCAGFCSAGVCVTPKDKTCSRLMEACTGPGGCCASDSGVPACIGGFCDVAVLQ